MQSNEPILNADQGHDQLLTSTSNRIDNPNKIGRDFKTDFYTSGKLIVPNLSPLDLPEVLFDTGSQSYNFISKSFVEKNRSVLQQYIENNSCSYIIGELYTILTSFYPL